MSNAVLSIIMIFKLLSASFLKDRGYFFIRQLTVELEVHKFYDRLEAIFLALLVDNPYITIC